MRRIAVIGSGMAGLLAAHGVRRAGHEVTLYSDRTPEQGVNHGSKMARDYVKAIARAETEGRALDEAWMKETFEAFWADHGERTVTFNNLLLEQYGTDGTGDGWRQRIAAAVVDNFVDPRQSTDAFTDVDRARRLVREASGRPWPRAFASSMARILVQQGRQALGLPARHSLAATTWVEREGAVAMRAAV